MSTFSISYNITGINNLKPVINDISKDFQKMQRSINTSMYAGLDKFNNKMQNTALKVSLPLTLGIATALKKFSEMENLEVGITTSLTNKGATTKEAKGFIKELTTFAKQSPFETFELMRQASTMSSMGVGMQDLIPKLKMLGDVAGATGGDFGRLARAYSQVKSKGKLQGEEIEQFAENMLGVRELMAKHLGKSTAEIMEMGARGELTFDMFNEALVKATSQGGIFFNSMNNKMKTFSGKFSTLSDTVGQLFIVIGEKFEKTLDISGKMVRLSSVIEKLTAAIEKMSPAMSKFVFAIIAFGIVAPPLLLTIGMMSKGFIAMRAGLGFLAVAQTRVIGLLPALLTGFTRFGAILLSIPRIIAGVIPFIIASIRQPMLTLALLRMEVAGLGIVFGTMFTAIGTMAKRFLVPLFLLQAVFVSLRGLVKGFTGEGGAGVGNLLSGIGKLLSLVMEVGKFINNIINLALTGIEIVFFKIGQYLAKAMNMLAKIPGLGMLKQEEKKEIGSGFIDKLRGTNTFLEIMSQEAKYTSGLEKIPTPKNVGEGSQNAEIKSNVVIQLQSDTPVKVKNVENTTSYARGNFQLTGSQNNSKYILGL